MTDKQQPIRFRGKDYFPNPSPRGECDGCVGFDNRELCMVLPFCHRTIFVERKPIEHGNLNSEGTEPMPLLEVSVLCDQARADGYAKGMAAKQAEWDKWQADSASVLDPSGAAGIYGVARTSDPATSYKAAQGMGRKAGRIRDLILVELRHRSLTGSQLAVLTGVALNSITPRFAGLCRAGLIHAADGSGRETVWAIGNGVSAT